MTIIGEEMLRECPIDSGIAEWREHPIRGTGSSGMEAPDLSIRCTVCGLEATRESTERWERGRGTYSIRDEAEAKLLARWNTRSPEVVTDEMIEAGIAESDRQAYGCASVEGQCRAIYTAMRVAALSKVTVV